MAFQNASDGSVVLVMVNSHVDARRVTVTQDQTRFQYTLPPQSVATFVWDPDQAGEPADTTSSPPVGKTPGAPATSGTIRERKPVE